MYRSARTASPVISRNAPATDKQVSFLVRLAAERGHSAEVNETALRDLTKAQASEIIESMLKLPKIAPAPANATTRQRAPITEPGMYRDASGNIFKVQKSRESGNLYAKALTKIGGERLSENEESVKWEFTYAPGAMRSLDASTRMTLDEAKSFGIQFGVCCVCGAFLKDAKSVAAGIGPVCASKV